jgi:putative FmdB family regulatory protein
MALRLSAAHAILAAMPIYEYRCTNGHSFEVFQSMSEDSLTECVECGAECERVLSAPAVHFKGSGFYTTDYARKGAKKAATDGGESKSEKASEKSSEKSTSDSGSSKSS